MLLVTLKLRYHFEARRSFGLVGGDDTTIAYFGQKQREKGEIFDFLQSSQTTTRPPLGMGASKALVPCELDMFQDCQGQPLLPVPVCNRQKIFFFGYFEKMPKKKFIF